MTYILDHERSKKYRTAVIVVQKRADSALDLELQSNELYWQKREGKKSASNQKCSFYRLRPLHSFQLLQKLACTKQLVYKNKPLICDFFSRLNIECIVEEKETDEIVIEASLPLKNTPGISLNACDLLLQGSPHYVVNNQFLRFIDPNICWKTLEMLHVDRFVCRQSVYDKVKQDLLDEAIILYEFLLDEKPAIQITPVLELVDYTLGFANLAILCGSVKRAFDRTQDASFEKTLIASGFVAKAYATSNYFCPLDQAPKALETLLLQGWKVYTKDKKELVAFSKTHYELDKTDTAFVLTGTCHFETESAPLSRLYAACQNNEKLIHFENDKVGLICRDDHKKLIYILPEIELVSENLHIKKEAVGLLSTLLDEIAEDCEAKKEVQALMLPQTLTTQTLHHFSGTLRAYQEVGVSWLHHLFQQKRSALLADEMGLGKTVQVLAFLSTLAPDAKTLIVVPTSLVHNWMNEIQTFLPQKKALLYHGPKRIIEEADIIVTSFATLRIDAELFVTKSFTCLVVDEAQAIKNKETQVFKALSIMQAHFRLSLTGTPIENSLSELINHFSFLQPTLFDSDLYRVASPEVIHLVKKKVSPYMLRRKKCDVAKDLPEKVEQTVFVEMSEQEALLYERLIKQFYAGLIQKVSLDGMKKCRMQVFEAILRLRQIACHPCLVSQLIEALGFEQSLESSKFLCVLEDIETLLSEGKKIVLFSQFTSMLSLFSKEATKRRWPHLVLEGKTKDRHTLVERFQNDPEMQLFFISLKAGGVGLNLTRADYVLLYDPWFNRAQEMQAIDRAHRIGRKDTVFAKRYVVKGSIEEKILALQEKKQALFNAVLDDDAIPFDNTLSDEDVLSLFNL